MKRLPLPALSERVKDHLIQALLIFASVFFAFWLNEARLDSRKDQERVELLEAVVGELQANQAILERWLPYHQELLDRSLSLIEAGPDSTRQFNLGRIGANRGIMREVLTTTAWNLMNRSTVQIELSARLRIIRIYEQQKFVDGALQDAYSFLKERAVIQDVDPAGNFRMFVTLISEIIGQEQALAANLPAVLAELESLGRI